MAHEYINLNVESDLGITNINVDAIKDVAFITASKQEGIYAAKKEQDMVNLKFKDGRLILGLNVRLLQDPDIARVCSDLQKSIYKNIYDMTLIKPDAININIVGFIKEADL